MKKVGGGWRVAAIVLGIIVIGFLICLVYGYQITNAENFCSNYCFNNASESFVYDYIDNTCSCYIGNELSNIIKVG